MRPDVIIKRILRIVRILVLKDSGEGDRTQQLERKIPFYCSSLQGMKRLITLSQEIVASHFTGITLPELNIFIAAVIAGRHLNETAET